jgi:heme/copper-type cytochrome/quinol oxidase subunit 2
MNKLVKFLLSIVLLATASLTASAQDAEMADAMRSEGKIYVVVAIVLVILLGLIGYLVFIERKVSGLEKRLPQKRN